MNFPVSCAQRHSFSWAFTTPGVLSDPEAWWATLGTSVPSPSLGTVPASSLPHSLPPAPPQFLQFKLKALPIEPNRFGGRVEFTGNPTKNDVSFTLHEVQLDDEGLYRCYVMNPPDRHKGIAKIDLRVITEGQCRGGGQLRTTTPQR